MCEAVYDDAGNVIGIRCPNAVGEPGVEGPTGPGEWIEPELQNGWTNVNSDPVKDIEEVLAKGFEEGMHSTQYVMPAWATGGIPCANCGKPYGDHCKVHLVPCCPGKCPKEEV